MTPKYSVVVVHGIGAGKGEERRGFSGKLKQLVAKSCPDIDACWHEAPWEGVNDKVDSVVHSVVTELRMLQLSFWYHHYLHVKYCLLGVVGERVMMKQENVNH